VPGELRGDLIDAVIAALVLEVKADATRDADKLARAATAAVEDVETYLDVDPTGQDNPVYETVEDVPARVMAGLVTLAAAGLKRPGFAYGVDGYDEADPLAVRARGAVMAALTPGLKERFGIA
jgi:hypothetical protein